MSAAAVATEASWRYERKFLLSEDAGVSPQAVLGRLRRHPAHFRSAHPERWVNSLYLDTRQRRAYHEAVEGLERRVKVRVRWYGPLFGHVAAPALEVKTKHGLVGAKQVVPLGALEIAPGLSLPRPASWLRAAGADDATADAVANLEPTLLVRYRRQYLVSADGLLRLTLDDALEFRAARTGRNRYAHRWRERGVAVLELKYGPDADDVARRATQALPYRVTKSSKYVRGLDRLHARF